jgi:hypothetical protein
LRNCWRRADFGDTGRVVCAVAVAAGAGLLVAGLLHAQAGAAVAGVVVVVVVVLFESLIEGVTSFGITGYCPSASGGKM